MVLCYCVFPLSRYNDTGIYILRNLETSQWLLGTHYSNVILYVSCARFNALQKLVIYVDTSRCLVVYATLLYLVIISF